MSNAFSFRRKTAISASLLTASLCLVLTGCIVKVDKHDKNGKKQDNVSVVTPFGGVHVQSNQTTAADLGLPAYPGAAVTTDNSSDKSANVDLGFGPWQLRVKVVNYTTSDPQDKVIAFYRKALGQFGTVIACQGDSPVGKPTMTDQGLTCKEDDKHVNVNGNNSDSGFNLRVGSPHHQRIVAFKDTGGNGTRFTLVELVLPEHSGKHATPD
jgi:hypothetical protein